MDKKEFLEELEERLIGISKEDKEEILQDYEEHFKAGKKKKRTEEEISKSLGEPKEIAKDIRKELSGKKEGEELKTEAIESWVALKKFSRHIFNETKDKVDEISDKFNPKKVSHWIWVALGIILFFMIIAILGGGFFFLIILIILIFLAIKIANKKNKKLSTKNKSKKNRKKYEEKSITKIILILLFNILIFVWIWISLFFGILAFFISGIIMIIAGILLSIFSVFYLINYSSPVLKDFLFSGLFAGFGISILGILFIILFDKILRAFFGLTKKYLKLNRRLIKK
jgi:uncharacterized membrane protein